MCVCQLMSRRHAHMYRTGRHKLRCGGGGGIQVTLFADYDSYSLSATMSRAAQSGMQTSEIQTSPGKWITVRATTPSRSYTPSGLLLTEYCGLFSRVKSGRILKLTTSLNTAVLLCLLRRHTVVSEHRGNTVFLLFCTVLRSSIRPRNIQ